jgi:hypothetical protein
MRLEEGVKVGIELQIGERRRGFENFLGAAMLYEFVDFGVTANAAQPE